MRQTKERERGREREKTYPLVSKCHQKSKKIFVFHCYVLCSNPWAQCNLIVHLEKKLFFFSFGFVKKNKQIKCSVLYKITATATTRLAKN